MGCDIHVLVEHFHPARSERSGRWVNADNWMVSDDFEFYPDEEGIREYELQPIYRDRHYWLFTLLAGVRGAKEDAIAPPRGVPDDIHRTTKAYIDSWGVDGHSHSCFTLAELWDFVRSIRSDNQKLHTLQPLLNGLAQRYRDVKWYLHSDDPLSREQQEQMRIVFFFDN